MFDATARRLIDPPLNRIGASLARRGVPANAVTLVGLGCGLLAAVAISGGAMSLALVLILLNRFSDGLDGAVARATRPSDFGGYLDITADFLFYGAIPFGFVALDPAQNGIAGTFLLAAFYVNGASFLGYAILAEKRGIKTRAQGEKSFFYSNGILEGTETIAFFAVLCLLPSYFAPLAWAFGGLTLLTTGLRLWAAYRSFES